MTITAVGNPHRVSAAQLLIPIAGTLVVLLLRTVAAARMPLTGDEAYYWEWSRRLAFGYVDHPPMVAWAIAAAGWLGRIPLAVRAGSLLAGALAAFGAFDFVRVATGNRVAGAWAAFAVNAVPIAQLTFGFATPDAVYLAAWICALACAQRALASTGRRWWIALGVAFAAALLSRIMATALLVGVALLSWQAVRRGRIRVDRPLVAYAIALAFWSPFLGWNAMHDAATFVFALVGRHHVGIAEPLHPLLYLGFVAVVCWFTATPLMAGLFRPRSGERPWLALVLATSLPLLVLLLALAVIEPVEVYWAAAPALSLLLAGIVAAALRAGRSSRGLALAVVPSALLSCAALILVSLPVAAIANIATGIAPNIRLQSALEPYAYVGLARALHERFPPQTLVLTDGYGLSSVLDFYGGYAPSVIGYNTEGGQTRYWPIDLHERDSVYIDVVPMSARPDMLALLRRSCTHVHLYRPFVFRAGATVLHAFYPVGCTGLTRARLVRLDRTS